MTHYKTVALFFCFIFSPIALFAQGVGKTVGSISWTDSMELTRSKLESTFGSATQDSTAGTVQSMGSFAGEPADILCSYTNISYLTKIQFTIDNSGEGKEAYVGYENAYATLQELYGSPTTINIITGERLWQFEDGTSITLRTSRRESQESRKTKGTLSGQGSIKGSTRTLGRDGGRTDVDYTLDLNPSHNAEGLVWDGEQVVKIIVIKTVVSFNRPIQNSDGDDVNQLDQAPASVSPTAPRP